MMHFHIMTLFPDMVMAGLGTSITGRAIAKGLLSIEAVNIRDYAFNKHNSVDDYPYGGGAGMLMQAEPVYLAYQAIEEQIQKRRKDTEVHEAEGALSVQPKRTRVSARRWPRSWQRRKIWCCCAATTRASTRGCWRRS